MALNSEERDWLRSAAENSAANKAMLEEHTNQLTALFKKTAAHDVKIERIDTKQQMCQKQNDPGNKSERTGVWVAIGGVVVAIILGIINLLK